MQESQKVLAKTDQNAGKRRRKDGGCSKDAGAAEAADADADADGDAAAEGRKGKKLKKRLSKRRLLLKTARKNTKIKDIASEASSPAKAAKPSAPTAPKSRVSGKAAPKDPKLPPVPKSKAKAKAKPTPVGDAENPPARKSSAKAPKAKVPPAPKPKGKAKGKAKASKDAKALPDPKSEVDGAAAAGEPRAKPRAKAKAKAGSLRPAIAHDMTIPLDDNMMERFVAYGQQCYGQEEKFDLETKKRLRSCLSSFEQANLIIYWTRPAVALKFKKHDRNKDFFYNAYPCPANICYRIHMLVSIQVGIEMAPCFQILCSTVQHAIMFFASQVVLVFLPCTYMQRSGRVRRHCSGGAARGDMGGLC